MSTKARDSRQKYVGAQNGTRLSLSSEQLILLIKQSQSKMGMSNKSPQLAYIPKHSNLTDYQHPKFWLSVRPRQPKSCRTTKNTDAVVRRTTINLQPKRTFVRVYLHIVKYRQPNTWTDN